MPEQTITFRGFEIPYENWSKLPHEFINQLPVIDSLGELKVVIYLLRHTWGYREYAKFKKITIDEFCNGRKRKDGSRMDNGTGLSEPTVRQGLDRAVEHGFISVEKDEHDKARIQKFYMLNIRLPDDDISGSRNFTPDENSFTPEYQNLYPGVSKSLPRSEKETLERNSRKKLNNSGRKKPARADAEIPEQFPFQMQSIAATFMRLTHLKCVSHSEYYFWCYGNPKRRARGFEHFVKDKITSNDLEAAHRYCRKQNISIKSPNSIYVFAHNEMVKRTGGNNFLLQEDQPADDPEFLARLNGGRAE